MKLKRFIIKTVVKCIILASLVIIGMISAQLRPIISNEMALAQMQNSNEMFILMNTYSNIRLIFNAIYTGITIWITSSIACDICKFFKNEKEKT